MSARSFAPLDQSKTARPSRGWRGGGAPAAAAQTLLHSPGRPLDPRTRQIVEYGLGSEPGRVRAYRPQQACGSTPPGGETDAERAAGALLATRLFGLAGPRQDFSSVRVHSDAAAAESATQQGALAYAVGNRIVFSAGRYRPDTPSGLRLLAHELTHLLQQGRDGRQSLDRFEARVHEGAERVGLTEGGAFTNEEASAVYFGNWMRDMNQVFVPLLTGMMPPEVIFQLISYMAAKQFGRELTAEQFGFYIPAEHLDNPAGLVAGDDILTTPPAVGAAQPPLPGRLGAARPQALNTPQQPVAPGSAVVAGAPGLAANIFSVDQTAVMAFIRRTNLHVERRLELAASTGRNSDGMHHFGAALHAVEDLFAHSNYVEIAVDKLLRNDPAFLPTPAGEAAGDRSVFTYSARSGNRPVLTTGTFTGGDTAVSLSSELVGLLSHPLPPPASTEERHAQERLMTSILRNFEARLQSSSQLRQTVRNAALQAGVPPLLASHVDQLPLASLYELKNFLGIPIPDSIRLPMQAAIRDLISQQILQPMAGRIQAAGLEARVSDTSLVHVLRDSQRQQAGGFTDVERASMRERERVTGRTVAEQQADTQAQAGRRSAAIQATPLHVVAGPSHSQLAKDHPNSPFFGLAFLLATVAVQRLRDRMLAAWADRGGGPTTPYNFAWSNFPAAPPSGASPADAGVYNEARNLYHTGRIARGTRETATLQHAQAIRTQGGAPNQPSDLATMRTQAANRIRAVASALAGLAGAPADVARATTALQTLAGALPPEIAEATNNQLARARAAASQAAAGSTVASLTATSANLMAAAALVEQARRHAQREQANAALVAQRDQAMRALAARPSISASVATSLLFVLDEEIQATAVAYTSEQRGILEGSQNLPAMGPSPAGLTVQTLNLPALTGSAATVALMSEARTLLGHPYDSNWWEQHVRAFATAHPAQLRNDIEARNEGVSFYRRSGAHP